MEISYLGHSSFRLKGKTATVVTDPFNLSIGLSFPKVSADIVTISHAHEDHNNGDSVSDVRKVIDGPGEYEIQDVSIIGTSTYHDDVKGADRGKNTIYLIEMDGLRICHLGDLGHKLSEKQVEDLGEINILMIPVGGVYAIGTDDAAYVAQTIEAQITIPMHYQTKGLDEKMFKDLVGYDEFVNKLGLPLETLEKFSVTKDSLDEQQRIVVLTTK